MLESYPVLSGAEPFFMKGNKVGILICHGFVGTPQSVKYLGESLAEQGYTVYGVRLAGHGTHYRDMEKCRYQDWIQSIEDGLHLLQEQCEEIFVVGQSMGGTLTLNLASQHPSIKGIMLINAAISSIPPMEEYQNKWTPRFVPEGAPDIKDKSVMEITYTKAPIASINQLFQLMNHTQNVLHKISCPTLAFQSIEDHVVPPENVDFVMNSIQSKEKKLVSLTNSYHVASMDFEKDFIAEQCLHFLEKHISNVLVAR